MTAVAPASTAYNGVNEHYATEREYVFAQSEGVERVHPSVMWAKLESLVEGARIASAELWGHPVVSASSRR